jgi:hypothetical protein
MNRLYAVLPWGIIGLGVLHMAATWRFYDDLTTASLWFFNGGIMLVFTGILNLVNRRDGDRAPALRWFCRAVNVVTLCFATVSGVVGGASAAQMAFVIGLIGAVTLLSLVPVASSVEQQ